MERINSDLQQEFKHPEINASFHFGTEEGDNYVKIDFYIVDKAHSELEALATKVNKYFIENYPEYDKLDFIEVRFTKADKKTADSFVNFKFE